MPLFRTIFCGAAALGFLSLPAHAQETPPTLALPLACKIGTDCWVMNYPDTGPDRDGAATDSACLSRTYEDHKGTDFAVADEAAMKKGVDVLAAKDGTVMRVRDGEADRWPTKDDLEKIREAKRECGNAVLIQHEDGWQTMYCHMKKSSLVVKPNQKIKAGEKIGQVGLSGLTEFPHLHFGLIHKDKIIDPFTGVDLAQKCGSGGKSLWDPALKLAYEPLTFFHLGFDKAVPNLKALDRERADRTALRKDVSALVFHAVILGAREDDGVNISIIAPDGGVFAQKEMTQEESRGRQMYYIGRKVPENKPLQTGTYMGKITVKRGDRTITREKSIAVQ